jgi:hypothetical protein
MNSLRELIRHGEYELAAYRLIYGVVQACVEERRDKSADPGCAAVCGHSDACEARKGMDTDV